MCLNEEVCLFPDLFFLFLFSQNLYIVGGSLDEGDSVQQGNLFTFPSNKNAELHMFLDPYAAKQVIAATINITLIPLNVQRKASSFEKLIKELEMSKETPEAVFVHRLLSTMGHLYRSQHMYKHLVCIMVHTPIGQSGLHTQLSDCLKYIN